MILQVADALEELVSRAPGGEGLDHDVMADCITFIRLYADALHHGKEEDLLFPELVARGMPREAGPIAIMLDEHRQGRAFARAMAESLEAARKGDPEASRTLVNAAMGYVNLIRQHILKEDHVLFEVADQMVRGPACRSLCQAYGVVCERHFEGRTREELEALARRIMEAVNGRDAEPAP